MAGWGRGCSFRRWARTGSQREGVTFDQRLEGGKACQAERRSTKILRWECACFAKGRQCGWCGGPDS